MIYGTPLQTVELHYKRKIFSIQIFSDVKIDGIFSAQYPNWLDEYYKIFPSIPAVDIAPNGVFFNFFLLLSDSCRRYNLNSQQVFDLFLVFIFGRHEYKCKIISTDLHQLMFQYHVRLLCHIIDIDDENREGFFSEWFLWPTVGN